MEWRDRSYVKYWAWVFLLGHCVFYVWIGSGIWAISEAFNPLVEDKIWAIFVGLFMILGGLWFLLGTYHVMWIDIQKHFVPCSLSLVGDEIAVKGLYLKTDTFRLQAIQSLTAFEVHTHWYKRVHSLFLPNVKHYKLQLSDGRAYHFHGDSTNVRQMLVELSGISDIPIGDEW